MKETIDASERNIHDSDDDYEDYDVFDPSIPDYYWGGEDGCEIIFRDDNESEIIDQNEDEA